MQCFVVILMSSAQLVLNFPLVTTISLSINSLNYLFSSCFLILRLNCLLFKPVAQTVKSINHVCTFRKKLIGISIGIMCLIVFNFIDVFTGRTGAVLHYERQNM